MNQHHDSMETTDDNKTLNRIKPLAEPQAQRMELEAQNNKLKDKQLKSKKKPDAHANRYDNIPVGYLTLDKAGNILAINQNGSAMLGKKLASILNTPFLTNIIQDDNRKFLNHLRKTFNSSKNTAIELRIKGHLGNIVNMRLESLAMEDASVRHMIMTNIDFIKESAEHNQELLHGNRRLMQSLFKAQEEERRLLARELHDELGQWLTAIHAETETIAYFSKSDQVIYNSAQAIKGCVKKMHAVMHDMLNQLRPVLLDTLGLEDALLELKEHWVTHNPKLALELQFEGKLDKLHEHINITIFRIVQEALNNIRNHAEASRVLIHLNRNTGATAADDILSLSIEDNGKGYDTNQKPKGLGLLGMRERAIAAGGKFSVHSMPNHGTQIYVKLPLDSSNRRRKTDDL